MFLKFANARGFSLPEIMVALGLVGGIAIITMKITEQNATNQSNIKAQADITQAVSLIEMNINAEGRCNQLFASRTRPSTLTTLTTTQDGKTRELLRENTLYPGFFIPTGGIQLTTSTVGTNITDLVITFEIANKNMAKRGSRDQAGDASRRERVIKRIPFLTEMNPSIPNQIRGCGPVVADSDDNARKVLCDSLGPAASWTGGVCRLNAIRCPVGSVVTKMTSLGSIQCVPIRNAIDPNRYFDMTNNPCASGTQIYFSQITGSKIKVRCN